MLLEVRGRDSLRGYSDFKNSVKAFLEFCFILQGYLRAELMTLGVLRAVVCVMAGMHQKASPLGHGALPALTCISTPSIRVFFGTEIEVSF